MEILDKCVLVTVNGTTAKWYEERGYLIPKSKIQLWYKGKKNGVEYRVKQGTQIQVAVADLAPASNAPITVKCVGCDIVYKSQLNILRKKKTNLCRSCNNKINNQKPESHPHWVKKLIFDAANPSCDICKETHKPFLELHHLLSPKLGGINDETNYVVLCANHHGAFHRHFMGKLKNLCKPEHYLQYKSQELSRLQ